jgi:hypothetical protein
VACRDRSLAAARNPKPESPVCAKSNGHAAKPGQTWASLMSKPIDEAGGRHVTPPLAADRGGQPRKPQSGEAQTPGLRSTINIGTMSTAVLLTEHQLL